jgi:hypothetical protein
MDESVQAYSTSGLSVGSSGGIFDAALVPGFHLSQALWADAPRLLVSIIAFENVACIMPQECRDVKPL